jgi:rare lipoprotein A (peptidoglycan hydrolase)
VPAAARAVQVIRLDGAAGTEYWMVFDNFRAITKYNTSRLYATAVYQLAESIAGRDAQVATRRSRHGRWRAVAAHAARPERRRHEARAAGAGCCSPLAAARRPSRRRRRRSLRRVLRPGDAKPESRRSPYAPAQEDLSKRGITPQAGCMHRTSRTARPADIDDVDQIPEPKSAPNRAPRYGNRDYTSSASTTMCSSIPTGYVETGHASFYGNKFHGRRTSSRSRCTTCTLQRGAQDFAAASFARVTNLSNGKSVIVRVNDRGPFHDGRVIDLSYAAAVKLGVHRAGTARVEVRALDGERSRARHARCADAVDVAPTVAPRRAAERDGPHGRRVADRQRRSRRAQAAPPRSRTPAAAGPWRFDMSRTASR